MSYINIINQTIKECSYNSITYRNRSFRTASGNSRKLWRFGNRSLTTASGYSRVLWSYICNRYSNK